MPAKSKPFNFEQALAELEALVARLEDGALPLEETLKQFERGVALTRECQNALKQAEQKVEKLVQKAGGDDIVPLDDEG